MSTKHYTEKRKNNDLVLTFRYFSNYNMRVQYFAVHLFGSEGRDINGRDQSKRW